jgi:hypothetical protein
MPDNLAPSEPVEVELRRLRDNHFSIIYSNWVQSGRTPWDIALAFGMVREVQPGDSAVVELVNIVMTPSLAKALIGTLSATVKEYERDNGEILIPETLKRAAQERARRSASVSPSPSASVSPSPEPPEGE